MKSLKEFFHDLRQRYLISDIDDNIKKFISNELDDGVIEEVLSKESDSMYTCRSDLMVVSEYCSKKNITDTYEVISSKGNKYTIYQSYIGLNFEAPCDQYVAHLYDSEDNLLYTYDSKVEKQKERERLAKEKEEKAKQRIKKRQQTL